MLTLEPPQFNIRGLTIFRDLIDPLHYYYLPSDKVKVCDNGKALSFVVYTEDITAIPDFSLSEDRAGGFLTLEVELGPSPGEVEQIRSELASQAGVGEVHLTQVPFVDGTVRLFILSQTGAAAAGGLKGFEVTVAGSVKPSLANRQSAVFSARLGGKAANVLYETLRSNADAQASVTYDLEYKAIQPSYNLEVEIDFKQTFSFLQHRIGVNLLVASADIDLMTQEMINTGSITIKEVDFSGKGNANSPIAGEGGILKLVRDLMSPTLFTTLPIPTPEYRALPDSASKALETGGGTKAFLSTGTATNRQPVTVGSDLKVTHTPAAAGQTPGAAVDIAASVETAPEVATNQVKVNWRTEGSASFQEVVLQQTSTGTPPPGGGTPPPGGGTPPPAGGTPPPAGGTPPPAGGTPPPAGGTPPPAGGTPPPAGGTPPPATGTPPPASGTPGARTATATAAAPNAPQTAPGAPETAPGVAFSGKIPGQPSGTTIEYFITVTGTKAGASVTQLVPAEGEKAPLSFTVGASSKNTGTSLKVPETDGPLIGYSLKSIDITQQIKRKFLLNRSEAVSRFYHPSGMLSGRSIGSDFDASKQITRVALGQGPFKIIQIKSQAGFDFDAQHVKAATVHIEYGKNPSGKGPLHALTSVLTKDKPQGQVQFFADDKGTQDYSYFVDFTYDPDVVIGTTPGQALRSKTFDGVTSRSITVDLDLHSPLIPVRVEPGVLSFENKLIRQVQVRVSPGPTSEGRIIQLDKDKPGGTVLVLPENPANRSYHMKQQFFFQDGSTTIEKPASVDTNVVVNEPNDLIFKMIPQLTDNTGLVKEVLVDAVYTHNDGKQERSTLHLNGDNSRNEFAVLLRANDAKEWDAAFRFVMNSGEPLEAVSQKLRLSEPLVTLAKSGFRVVSVALLDETAFAADANLLGIKVILGANLADPALPTTSVLLRSTRTSANLVVPGVTPNGAVSVAVDVLRRGQPPVRTSTSLAGAERELFVTT